MMTYKIDHDKLDCIKKIPGYTEKLKKIRKENNCELGEAVDIMYDEINKLSGCMALTKKDLLEIFEKYEVEDDFEIILCPLKGIDEFKIKDVMDIGYGDKKIRFYIEK